MTNRLMKIIAIKCSIVSGRTLPCHRPMHSLHNECALSGVEQDIENWGGGQKLLGAHDLFAPRSS